MDIGWAIRGLIGGALIGLSASVILLVNGRVAGISGIVGGLLGRSPIDEAAWRSLFVGGLLIGGVLGLFLVPGAFPSSPPSLPAVLVAGALVGVGTRIGNGCTSGHGVCGLSRFSPRSLVATLTFIATGALTVAAIRILGGLS